MQAINIFCVKVVNIVRSVCHLHRFIDLRADRLGRVRRCYTYETFGESILHTYNFFSGGLLYTESIRNWFYVLGRTIIPRYGRCSGGEKTPLGDT